jgi:hypothetical protein
MKRSPIIRNPVASGKRISIGGFPPDFFHCFEPEMPVNGVFPAIHHRPVIEGP